MKQQSLSRETILLVKQEVNVVAENAFKKKGVPLDIVRTVARGHVDATDAEFSPITLVFKWNSL